MTGQPALPTVEEIAARLSIVQQRIDAVRQPDQDVAIVAVTKTFPAELSRRAVAAGLTELGENYAQELAAKADELADLSPDAAGATRWHFIGGLQRNKVKLLGQRVAVWQTIDRSSLVDELAKRLPGASLFVQVNTTEEEQKSGCRPADAAALVDQAREGGLDVRGLMTIGPTDGSTPEPAFEQLRQLADDVGVAELSMGMSADFETAIRCGSTMVRIGSVLFGPRRR
jgi:pyridoxal phosphate enzyme (YggS family)